MKKADKLVTYFRNLELEKEKCIIRN